jgi:polar amino acid transport system permease protein
MIFDPAFAISILPILAQAALVTLKATAVGFSMALIGGLLLALGRLHGNRPIRILLGASLEFVRSTPLLVQVFFLYFVLPKIGIRLGAFEAGVSAIAIHYSAYLAEVFRAGIEGVPKGQWEAARALGFRTRGSYLLVVLPQAVSSMMPAIGNYLILMFKDTPLLSAVSVLELMQTAKAIGAETFRYVEPFSIVAVFFLVMSLCGSALIRVLEHRSSTKLSR